MHIGEGKNKIKKYLHTETRTQLHRKHFISSEEIHSSVNILIFHVHRIYHQECWNKKELTLFITFYKSDWWKHSIFKVGKDCLIHLFLIFVSHLFQNL